MNKSEHYTVKLYPRAYRDLDDIYTYIAKNLLEPGTASHMVGELEKAIYSLEQLPERGAIRRIGAYANRDYRQLFVKIMSSSIECGKKKRKCILLPCGMRRATFEVL